jgi:3-carboxy-cis,cis-muconate cycloisomerase
MLTPVTDSLILQGFCSTLEMTARFQDRHLVQCWLDVEAALAKAEVELNTIPATAGQEISRRAQADLIDLESARRYETCRLSDSSARAPTGRVV